MRRRSLNATVSTALAMQCSFYSWPGVISRIISQVIRKLARQRRPRRLAARHLDAAAFAAPQQPVSGVDADEVAAVVALAALFQHFIARELTRLAQHMLL